MARGKQLFKQTEITRAIRAVLAVGGLQVVSVEIDPTGKIIVIASKSVTDPANSLKNEWDTLK